MAFLFNRKVPLLNKNRSAGDRTAGGRKNERRIVMAKDKKLVEAITSMDVDFAQWYTDVVKKAELIDYSSVKGCMVIKPAGYAIWENIQN